MNYVLGMIKEKITRKKAEQIVQENRNYSSPIRKLSPVAGAERGERKKSIE